MHRYSGAYVFTSPTLIIRDPDLIKKVLVKDFDHFLNHKPMVNPDDDPIWNNNLFAMQGNYYLINYNSFVMKINLGQRWKELRQTVTTSFTSSKMKKMFSLMVEASKQFIDYFDKQDENLISLEMKDTYTRFANDVIASCTFGVKVDSLNDRENDFYVRCKEVTSFTGVWKSIKFFLYVISPFVAKVLNDNDLRRTQCIINIYISDI